MSNKLKQLWQLLKTDVKDLRKPAGHVESGAEIVKDLLDCAGPLELLAAPFMPIAPVVSAGLLGVGLTARLVKFIGNKSDKELNLQEWVIFTAQVAYAESFHSILNLSDNTDLVNNNANNTDLNEFKKKLEKLENLELTEAEAKNVLRCFHESDLAEEFKGILLTLLKQAGLSVNEAEILTERVAWGTHRYLNEALASVTDKVPALAQLYRDGWRKESDKYHSLDEYLEKQIATKPQETVFHEAFTFQQIYVPLEVKSVYKNGEVKKDAKSVNLEAWAKNLLLAQNKQNPVMFIQGGPGRGKSVFCRIFADLVRRELHPIWTPILIRLRDIITFENSFQHTLKEAINYKFVKNDDGWLTDKNTRYLFLLDGFDELVLERRNIKTLQDFLEEVGQFQEDCSRSSEMGHRVLITGRSLALHSIETWLPENIERMEILPMNEALQQQWFVKWEAIVGAKKDQELQALLKDRDCPKQVEELAKEPLLLYLLAAMHRAEKIQVEEFAGVSNTNAKIFIYEKVLDWVLNKQRETSLNQKLTRQEPKDLQRILIEAGLCVVQSGGECAAISMIEERLKSDERAKALLEEAQKYLEESALKNALATFYLQTGSKEGSVEFCHKSFGEFLCAIRIKEGLINWTKLEIKQQNYKISDKQFDMEIYDLLGYGGLTPEIVEYLTALLRSDGEFRPVELFQRLEDFYLRWCEGELIDATPDNLPQKKMQLLKKQVKSSGLGLRQVDIYAGLNVMILLLELNRYAQSPPEPKDQNAQLLQSLDKLKDQIVFYPCGKPDIENFDQFRLSCIIGYCHCIDANAFKRLVGSFFSGANLSGANLSRAGLSDANFSGANLSRANFSGANLSRANLSDADLSRADLSGANLSDANLSGANLNGANLSDANLSDANLSDADLSGADLSDADLSRAYLSDADLSRAYLSDADLSRADLSDAYLSDANFSGADLSGVYLSGADLSGAYLRRANLSDANLTGADLSRADLENVRWYAYTKWGNAQGLETARNVPEALKQQLGLL